MSKQSTSDQNKGKESTDTIKKTCGIIMPIADHPDYPIGHWKEVLQIIKDSLSDTEFEVKLVSDSIEIGLIHERIVTNIYTNDIVICDVSSKNPNVMFELGMRLAFDKPTIIIKDENTGYSFDTGVIEHINYLSSLRHSTIEVFKAELKRRVLGTYEKSKNDPNHSPFLKGFGRNIVAKTIEKSEISEGQYIIEKLDFLSSRLLNFEVKKNIDQFPQLAGRVNRQTVIPLTEQIKTLLRREYTINQLETFLTNETDKEHIIETIKYTHRVKLSLTELTTIIFEIINEKLN